MKKACIIAAYFGKLPDFYPLWLHSIKYNTEFDFLLVTDNEISGDNLPDNLRVVNMSLKDMKALAKRKLGMDEIALDIPYKCCDYKPVYGIIFEYYIKEYPFVGHCDLDMIFGNINEFISDDMWNRYDKLLPLGHLAFYRNDRNVLEYYKLSGNVHADYREAFSTNEPCVFDEEVGINNIYRDNDKKLYDKYIMADISEKNTRLKLTDMSVNKNKELKNYRHQLFYFEDGRVLRSFIDKNNNVGTQEYIYFHAKKRSMDTSLCVNEEDFSSFYILGDRVVLKRTGENDGKLTKDVIKEYSQYVSEIRDRKEVICYYFKDLLKRGKKKCKKVIKRLLR